MMAARSGLRWLSHLEAFLEPSVSKADWAVLSEFESVLAQREPRKLRKQSSELLALKRSLATAGYGGIDVPAHLGGRGRSGTLQMLVQFLCGYADLDYRDISHVGHGRMVLMHASDAQLRMLAEPILRGDLIGIAVTEPHGGTVIQSMRSCATKLRATKWVLSGQKCWISRITEATAFVVFFKLDGSETIGAAILDPRANGITIEQLAPAGLHGWSWGRLNFDQVEFDEEDMLGPTGSGLEIFREHFAYYRPLVAITALGGAAALFDELTTALTSKINAKGRDSVRDSAWEALGHGFIEIQSAMLSALVAAQLVGSNRSAASIWSRASKAFGCYSAHAVASRLAIFAGAVAYHEDSRITKILEDLRAFLYADGVIDALFRSTGREIYAAGWTND